VNIVGIDIGGTTIKADLYQSDGRSLNQFREVATEIDFEKKTNQILEQVCQLIAFYKEKFELDGVAISSAGVVDSQAGKISYAGYTIPGYIGTDFRSRVLKEFGLPIAIENDVNCAALGEAWLGAAKGHASAVMKVTVTPGKDSSDDKIIPYKEKGSKVKAMHLTDELDTNKSKALDMMYAYYGEIAANKTKYSVSDWQYYIV